MEMMAIRAQRGREAHPERADIEAEGILDPAASRPIEEAAERRQFAGHGEAPRDLVIAGVERDVDDWAAGAHRRFFSRTKARSASKVGPLLRRCGASVV